MFKIIILLISLSLITFAYAAPTKLTWVAPTTNEDGSALTNLAGYKIHCGTVKTDLSEVKDVGKVTEVLLSTLNPACKFYAVTAYNTSGFESVKSSICDTLKPSPVGGCQIR